MNVSIHPRKHRSPPSTPFTSTALSIAAALEPGFSWLARSADRVLRIVVLAVLGVAAFLASMDPARAGSVDSPRNDETANARLVQKFYAAFMSADSDATMALVTPDFVMHVPGKGLNAGEYWGREGLQHFMTNIREYNGGVFSMNVEALATGAGSAFTREAVVINRKQDPDKLWSLRFLMEYRIKDGLVSEAWTIPEDQYAYDAFWTPGSTPNGAIHADRADASSPPQFDGATAQANELMIRAFYRDFWLGKLDGMRTHVSPDLVFHVPGCSHLAGDYHGWAGYLAFREKLLKLAGDRYKLEIETLATSSRDVFVKEYVRMNRKWDGEVQTVYVILHFQIENGRIVRINDIPVDTHEYEAFFTKPTSS